METLGRKAMGLRQCYDCHAADEELKCFGGYLLCLSQPLMIPYSLRYETNYLGKDSLFFFFLGIR